MPYKIVFSVLLSLILTTIKAQEVVLSSDKYPEIQFLGLSGKVFFNEYQQVRGSAFLFDDWSKGDVYYTNGTIVKNINLKLDIYTHQVLAYQDLLKRILILEKKDIKSIVLYNLGVEHVFKRVNISKSKSYSIDGIFVEVLAEGKISFYKLYYKERIFLSTPVKPYIYEFSMGKEYYLDYNSESSVISLGRRSLFKRFPELKTDLKQYIRSSHLKLKTEKDFALTIDYLNSIKK